MRVTKFYCHFFLYLSLFSEYKDERFKVILLRLVALLILLELSRPCWPFAIIEVLNRRIHHLENEFIFA
jgi:hypothetical protein